ncbi:helix-turn-helix domain-containing protein [Spirosoma sp. RP8]|uniref:Helix-turn-helix domain-containing protein n=1 Tax=Spirosoma liriopis TaxID=2937440 RepID=A0ABT0HDI1_9BACT|nr:helix-turn-helix domain-containing protein [Spirosoma liriopis]MCK8490221.1 helix-turn-helix domain-containing protein [Spirosoma liriopis]
MGGSAMDMSEISQQLQQQQLTATQRLALIACFKATLTLEEAAAYAGLSTSHFYKLTSSGKIPHYKPAGKVIYVDRVELDGWLKRNRVKTTEEIEHQVADYVRTNKPKQTAR